AREACEIEINNLKRPIGKQDQYIAAYGGLRSFKFGKDGNVITESIKMDSESRRRLGSNLLLFFTNMTREASSILEEQSKNVKDNVENNNCIKELAYESKDALLKLNIDEIGVNLRKKWEMKKKLAANVS